MAAIRKSDPIVEASIGSPVPFLTVAEWSCTNG